ncbi:P-loop containing nucleoside triphosphate hydrolase protein [Ramaria rubella]|nr:P-loop containing nucleoside triphosphate hydrolase protein [Ramaria rubella]
MRRIRRLSTALVSRPPLPCARLPATARHSSALAEDYAQLGVHDEVPLLGDVDDTAFDQHPTPGEEPLPVHTSRYDWRYRAPSRRRPGGLIDPPLTNEKVRHPRRYKPPTVPLSFGEPWYEEIQNYRLRFLALLTAEQETETNLIKTRLANWPRDKLQRDGYCLTGLSSFWLHSNQFGKPVAAFLLGPGIALPYHRFENGTKVLLSRLDPLKDLTGQGSVIGSSETEIRISFDEKLDLGKETWRIDLYNTDIAYERMRSAIHGLNFDPAEQERGCTVRSQSILEGTHLRDIILPAFSSARLEESKKQKQKRAPELVGGPGIFAEDQFISSWARRYSVPGEPVVVEGDPGLGSLNATQRRAIALMLRERVSLVQGPPGTGKTKTIIETIKLLKAHFQIPQPVLVCTYTNVAVDNLVEGLAAAGIRPLRVGYSAKVKPSLLPHTLHAQLETHPLKPELDSLQKSIDALREYMERVEGRRREAVPYSAKDVELTTMLERMGRDLGGKKGRAWAMNREMVQDIVGRADVICTTCITAATPALGVIDFPVVFLDEASMSTEPASLIPLMKGARHVALIGDHKQLPPVIASRKAKNGGLGKSLFERLTEEKTVPSIMLDMQYRMHPSLSRFPSSEFYDFSLRDGTVPSALLPPTSAHLQVDPATGHRPSVIFLDHAGGEEMKDRSRVNHNEARIVCAVIEDLLMSNPGMSGHDIGVIAPYAAQISLLERLLKSNKAYRAQLETLLGPLRAMQVGNVEVKTVDGFEGREKEVIVFSTVRNNARGHIGFLADRRRMNVGLTRAKRGLFVVGSVGR